MSDIRIMTPGDIPAVAKLFQKTFRNPRVEAPPSLERTLNEVLFEHPEADPELPSWVYAGKNGMIAGFIGTLPLSMAHRGRKIRAAVPTSLAVDDPKHRTWAGPRLIRSFLSGPQDISICEPVSEIAQGLCAKLGAICVPSESMEWLRIFRPFGLTLAQWGNALPVRAGRGCARVLDLLMVKAARGYFTLGNSECSHAQDADASDDELLAVIPEFANAYTLYPAWSDTVLKWMLRHAGANEARGPIHRRIVYGAGKKPLGCYLYHVKPGGIAWALQILAHRNAIEPVIDSMFAHAWDMGAVAIKGRTQLRLLDPLLQRKCIFYRRHTAAVHSRDPDLLAAVRAGEAVTSGFAAESWLRLSGDRFQ